MIKYIQSVVIDDVSVLQREMMSHNVMNNALLQTGNVRTGKVLEFQICEAMGTLWLIN